MFGYSHLLDGFEGGQAEYVRVPYANIGPMKEPDSLNDEQALFLSDILPTGWQAAENANIQDGDTVAVWGCGQDRCVDAVGDDAHGGTLSGLRDKAMDTAHLETSKAYVLQQIIQCCKKGGNVSVPGVYIGPVNMLPFGAAMNKRLTFRMGQTHMQHYMKPLSEKNRSRRNRSYVHHHSQSGFGRRA